MRRMEDIGLFNQGLKWLKSKNCYSVARSGVICLRNLIGIIMEQHWPIVCCGCVKSVRGLVFLLVFWKNCFLSGFQSFVGLKSAALLVIMWSCFLSLTSVACLMYLLLSMGTAAVAVQQLGYTPGIFIVGLFAILILWMYGNFWITGTLFVVGGYLFSLNHGRLVVFMATLYAIYSVKVRIGWLGVFLAINLAFLSNDALSYFIKWCDNLRERNHVEEHQESYSFTEDDFSTDCDGPPPVEVDDEEEEVEKLQAHKSVSRPASPSTFVEKSEESSAEKVARDDNNSIIEIERILNSGNHYEALGFPCQKKIDAVLLKKEYYKKAMLVHPDKNMGRPLASESFKKLQCAYEVLSNDMKRREYDERLKKEESKRVMKRSASTSCQTTSDFCSEESRRIQCTKCGNSHIWVCTNRTKGKARWCQDCCQYHPAKDGDGWVEDKGSLVIPRAFVCAESKIFDVSEWALCQGIGCKANSHGPSFHVNMVGLERPNSSNSNKYPWDLDAEMLWLQQALASGLFGETSKRRPKSWSPFNLKGKKQWRRAS